MAEQKTQAQIASELAAFLTTSTYGSRKSPLDEMLQAQITQLTRQIAADVIAATPELAPRIKLLVEQTIRRALAEDTWLNSTVIDAVSKAITTLSLDRRHDE